MLCSTCGSHHQSVREPRTVRLTGTYDFRWPLGATIRVAFQRHSDASLLDSVRGQVRHAFEAWGVREQLDPTGPQLTCRMVDIPDGPPTDAQALGYDVLISIEALPVAIAPDEFTEQEARNVEFPQSVLGTYARREGFAIPTMYLGRPGAFRSSTDAEWFDSAEGRFTIAHEIGHALGLAHEHQSPKRNLVWKEPAAIAEIIRLRNGGRAPINANFIVDEITRPWDGAEFSEWQDPAINEEVIDSVMTKPIYRCLLQGDHECAADFCQIEQDGYVRLSQPTDRDRAHLRTMYRV